MEYYHFRQGALSVFDPFIEFFFPDYVLRQRQEKLEKLKKTGRIYKIDISQVEQELGIVSETDEPLPEYLERTRFIQKVRGHRLRAHFK